MIQIVSKKYWVTHELQGTDISSTNKDSRTYNSKKECYMNGKKDLEESLMWFIQQFNQHLYWTANSIVHLIVWVKRPQILRYRQQYISLRRIQHNRAVLMDTSWLKSRKHKFKDKGKSIFLQERSSTAATFSEGFTPYSLFYLNCREQQGLKTSTSCENQ